MDVGNIAELNTFLVLDAIRARGEVTRSQLSTELGLSDASISRIVKRLLASGIIDEAPGTTAIRGRTPSILRFVGPVGGVIAVDLGGTLCRGALADLAGGTVAEDFRSAGEGPDAAASLLGCVAALREAARGLGMPVRAVVVGIPALIDPVSGLATAGPNVHWQDFDLLDRLRRELAEPFEVDNDVNLAALGQAWRGAGRGVGSFVTMSLGTGVGGAVVLDGHLVRGRHNAGGEIGYLPMSRGRRASLEDVVSGRALHARAAALLARGVESSLDAATFEVADLFVAAAGGDLLGRTVVDRLVGDVAMAVAGVAAVVDPERVILDGSIGRALEPWLPVLREAVAAQVFAAPEVVVSDLGPDATITGAVARALAVVSELDAPAHLSRLRKG
jgi:glucokinase